jgi:hypothetical protein
MSSIANIQFAKARKWWETWYPWIIGFLGAGLMYYLVPLALLDQLYNKDILASVLTIAGILFGFLLTMLTFLLQTNNSAMERIKRANRLRDVISYNRSAVYFAAVLTLVGFILQVLEKTDFLSNQPVWSINIIRFLWLGIICMTVTHTYRYLDIFYTLITKD